MINIVFLGYAVSAEKANALIGASIAGNKMQISILRYLSQFDSILVKAFTVYPVAAYPKSDLYISGKSLKICKNIESQRIAFVNLPIIKQVWQILSLFNHVKKEVTSDTIVITFNCFPQIGVPARWLKRRKHCKIVALLADLPIDDNNNKKNILGRGLRRLFDADTKKSIRSCDGLIVLNTNAVRMYAPGLPFIVVEGGVNTEEVTTPYEGTRGKNIIYSGALTHYSGIMELIKAMELVHDNQLTLEIYGKGPLQTEIELIAKEGRNIKFEGMVDNSEMIDRQRKAYLLVNPRPTNNPIAKVTFPSKLFEYMSSGTPVLTTKLDGLEDDFLSRMFVVNSNNPIELAEMIDYISKTPDAELRSKAEDAYDFIIRNKNWRVQCEKIRQFLTSI